MLTLSIRALLDATGGELLAGPESTVVNGLAIDSRSVEPASVFVAFSGEHADGHLFVADALANGARAAIVTRDDEQVRSAFESAARPESALVQVGSAQGAVEALGSWHRERLMCPVIGITGSTGKTTTKDFLRSVLSTRMRVVATAENRNNELGVPLTIMDAGASTEVLIVEMAMRGAGQIAHLCEISRPTAGLVTNVGVSHMEILGSEEAIASAKGELVSAIPASGRVFLNGDDGWTKTLAEMAHAPVVRYGLGSKAEVRASDIEIAEDGTPAFTLKYGRKKARVQLSAHGRHNVYNALAAASVGFYLGLEIGEIVQGLEAATFSKWRMESFQSASGLTIINDAYNANPTSMRAAISALNDIPTRGKHIAVLGDMAELGSLAELAHFQLGAEIANDGLDVLITVGERGRRIAEGALAAGMDMDMVRPCATADEASEVLDDIAERGDTVLVKASRVMGLERVVEGMIQPRV